uniref:fructose-bisphosphate aldolase n=1 Tax=Bigelowiella natans TaxID=227086 RepID=Q84RH8_BIGNA|nr:cytosolic class II fructose-1,6-bisphosphate aldolase [Bigelowiella natans]|mmetsp:Transcript_46054/g.74071  ORF Transcript_46054/g.74071 Transcript_46054/m.74071 type:complete len:389 (-) Transcript_46054:215-1381(-)|eukprot:jgi/Bigna1/92329/estExt_fgenesh1_pm.C_150006
MSESKLDIPTGVLTGDQTAKLFAHASANGYAIPAFNCTSSSTINCVLEAARDAKSPIIIQVSNSGAGFYAGKSLPKTEASILGAVAAAMHVRTMSKFYGVPVVLHSDHCAKKLLPWFDGMLKADEEYFKVYGVPLFSSHMLDLSEEKDDENIETCVKYFEKMTKLNMFLEMEIGQTGGEEDGVKHEGDVSELFTHPDQIWKVHKALSAISPNFSIAAAFGNFHGVYKAPDGGNRVKLQPQLLGKHQAKICEELKKAGKDVPATGKPTYLVMHGGSGSEKSEILEAVKNGVVKMNVDTDTQWAYWDGVHEHYKKNGDRLWKQLGGKDNDDGMPNKKKYDPRVWIREAEKSMAKRVTASLTVLGSVGKYASKPELEGGAPVAPYVRAICK